RAVLRVSDRASALHDSVSGALLALRVATGVSVSAALLLSLVAALVVSSPLRRMRDAARAFARARWVAMPRPRGNDELAELAEALDELGQRIREHLIEIGSQESLVTQALEAAPLPALLFSADLRPLAINGAFRGLTGTTAVNEEQKLAEVLA